MAARKAPVRVKELRVAPYLPKVITDKVALKEAVEFYLGLPEFVFDVETRGPHRGDPERNDVFWITLAGPGRTDVIPMQHPTGNVSRIEIQMTKDGSRPLKNAPPIPHFFTPPEQLFPGEVFEVLEPLFFSDIRKIGHNVKFDLRSVAKYFGGHLPAPPYGDTMISTFLVWENYRGNRPYGLDACVRREFGYQYQDKTMRTTLETFPFSEVAKYCHLDGKWTWLLWQKMLACLDEEGLTDLHEFECEVLTEVAKMEYRGADINEEMIAEVDRILVNDINNAYATVNKVWRQHVDSDINLNATAQVAKLVYEIRKHPVRHYTEKKQEPSTKADHLEPYKHKDLVVASYLDWAVLHKLHSTFVTGIRDGLVDGRVHATFDQRGARTGRFSSSNPNLQNIPVRTERGRKIRELFIAPPGYRLVIADYSQIELRVLAHFSRDPMLMKAYHEQLDLHTITAMRGYNTDTPTYEQRAKAKNVNFSMVFRAGPQTLVDRYGIGSLREAENLMDAFFGLYVKVKPWSNWLVDQCRRTWVSADRAKRQGTKAQVPYVETILGRKRRLPDIVLPRSNQNFRWRRSAAERQCINTKIQGSAADINKLAIRDVGRVFRDRDWHMVLTVHDELVSVVPAGEADEAAILVREAMEGVIDLRVPLVADVKVADQWSEKG